MRILLVEDDPLLGEGIVDGLTDAVFLVDWITHCRWFGRIALAAWANSTLPTLLLTARDSISERVEGLNSGADDYLLKPFTLSELVARLRVLLRRQFAQPSNQT